MFLTDGVTDTAYHSELKTEYALIAQSVEHAAVNRGVTGSSPVWGANKFRSRKWADFFIYSLLPIHSSL